MPRHSVELRRCAGGHSGRRVDVDAADPARTAL